MEGFQILGGFHRWEIANELGYATVPCVVVEVDDKRAKVREELDIIASLGVEPRPAGVNVNRVTM